MSRRIITESTHRKGVYTSVSIVADETATDGDIRDSLNVATAKAAGKIFPDYDPREAFGPLDHSRHVHFAVAGGQQLPLPFPSE